MGGSRIMGAQYTNKLGPVFTLIVIGSVHPGHLFVANRAAYRVTGILGARRFDHCRGGWALLPHRRHLPRLHKPAKPYAPGSLPHSNPTARVWTYGKGHIPEDRRL